jgi:uncharacterized protein (DUF433 family)
MGFERIDVDDRVMSGVPCIRGTRIPVATAVAMVAEGMSFNGIVCDFPQLPPDDIQHALRFTAAAVDQQTTPLQPSA